MDTRYWGPSGWRLLHLISFKAEELRRDKLHIFFKNLPYVLPCKFCRASLTDYYLTDPIPAIVDEFPYWLYRIHNRVNAKLRDQKLLETSDPKWSDVKKRYTEMINSDCIRDNIIGWDFLFSVAFTTPCPSVKSAPMPDAPPIEVLFTPLLRNRWGVITRDERLIFIKEWWDTLPYVLPFKEWRKAWRTNVPEVPSLLKGRKAITSWLYAAENALCVKKEVIHESFTGLCSELKTFSSGCGKRSKRIKTCRAIKSHAKKTLKTRRVEKYKATGGFL
jgi:hypothetical protein